MKITIIHGSDTTRSRERFYKIISTIKKRGWDIVRLDEVKSLSADEAIISSSLFSQNYLYVSEDITSFKKGNFPTDGNLLVWHSSDLGKTAFKGFPKDINIEHFPLPKTIFAFLDSLFPGNSKTVLTLLHQVLENEPVEFVFALLARRFRDLYWLKVDRESFSAPGWLKSRLISQVNKYDSEKLTTIINELSEIDIAAKTSQADLTRSLDLLILKQLQ